MTYQHDGIWGKVRLEVGEDIKGRGKRERGDEGGY